MQSWFHNPLVRDAVLQLDAQVGGGGESGDSVGRDRAKQAAVVEELQRVIVKLKSSTQRTVDMTAFVGELFKKRTLGILFIRSGVKRCVYYCFIAPL